MQVNRASQRIGCLSFYFMFIYMYPQEQLNFINQSIHVKKLTIAILDELEYMNTRARTACIKHDPIEDVLI